MVSFTDPCGYIMSNHRLVIGCGVLLTRAKDVLPKRGVCSLYGKKHDMSTFIVYRSFPNHRTVAINTLTKKGSLLGSVSTLPQHL